MSVCLTWRGEISFSHAFKPVANMHIPALALPFLSWLQFRQELLQSMTKLNKLGDKHLNESLNCIKLTRDYGPDMTFTLFN